MTSEEGTFAASFEDSPMGTALLRMDGTYSDVNPALLAMFGLGADAIINRHYTDFLHPDDLDHAHAQFQDLVQHKISAFQFDTRFRNSHKQTVWTRVSITHGQDSSGEPRCVAQLEDITEIHQANTLLRERTQYDQLTGLPNRTHALAVLKTALLSAVPENENVVALSLGIDNFTIVNTSLGHTAGDALIISLSQRISHELHEGDTVARFRGSSFMLQFASGTTLESAYERALTIVAELQEPITLAGHVIVPRAAGGIAVSTPDHTAQTLVQDAEAAMLASHGSGKESVTLFTAEHRRAVVDQLSTESELRRALDQSELTVHFQPIVDIRTGTVAAYEALARWNHPVRGMVYPDEFIPVAEDSGLIVPLGEFVLARACELLSRNPQFTGRVFINVSTKQIGRARMADVLTAALSDWNIDAGRVALELTESGVLQSSPEELADLEAITRMGIELVVDDFGTGYSSLTTILQNPIAGVKLPREFSSRLGDKETGDRISSAMAGFVSAAGMYGVVEGIETEAQWDLAAQHGWHFAQGFLCGRPAPMDELTFRSERIPPL